MSKRSERFDALGTRMKAYEQIETLKRFPPNSILCVRIDGRSFSKFTKGLKRPYDERLSSLMVETTKYVVDEHKCLIGYTQSDEMSFIILNKYEAPCDFDAKVQKLVSAMTSSATAYFNANLGKYLPEKVSGKLPRFDCRIWVVPNFSEATNVLLWREQDAIKNSVSMLAQHHFSHKELQHVNTSLMKDMLLTKKEIRWDDEPEFFKKGTYVKRVTYEKQTEHGTVTRHKIDTVDLTLTQLEHDDRVFKIFGES